MIRRTPLALVTSLTATWLAFAAVAAEPPPVPPELVRLRVESAGYSPSGRTLSVELRVEISAGWHVNAHDPTLDTLVPTTLSVEAPRNFDVGPVEYPPAEERALGFAGGQTLRVYSGSVLFRIPLQVRGAFTEEGANFVAHLRYQACDDTRCLRPADVDRTFLVKSPPGTGDGNAPGAAGSGSTAPIEQWLRERGLPMTLLLVALMGLGLNLTPCVYPLISVTIAYFGGQARDERGRVLLLSVVYALGIALTFSALGVTAALTGSLFGRALQHPATLVGIATLMTALALSSFGLYTLQPPAWVLQRVGASSRGVPGALFMGLTMGVVAAPCVGPIIVGLLLAVGARGEVWFGWLLFFTLALGLGAPYVILASAAGSIARLPRSGEWLRWVEHLFGFVLLGLALYFLSPLLSASLNAALLASLLAAAGITLGFLDSSAARRGPLSFAQKAIGTVGMLTAAWVVVPAAPHGQAITWQPFSKAALEAARSEQRPAVVDFRADWCLPCLEMERTTFVDPAVTARTRGISMLRADVTESSPPHDALLDRYQVLGVPTTIFYGADGSERDRRVGYVAAEEFAKLLEKISRTGPGTERAGGTT